MSPTTPADGGDPTPLATPMAMVCPHCGKPLPPLALPVARLVALERKLASAAFPFPPTQVGDAARLAPTERLGTP